MSSWSRGVRSLLGGTAGIAVAMGVMNLATYGYTIVAARMLGPGTYGGFAAVMGVLLVVGVLQLGLQATGARRIASAPGDVSEIEATLVGVTHRAALVLATVCLLLTPVLNQVLRLDNMLTAALVALAAWPMTMMGGQAGILQGERRWYPLAVLYVAAGVPRLLVGTALLAWRPTETMAMLGVAIGFFAPVVVGWAALRRSASRRSTLHSGLHPERNVLAELLRNSHALLAFFALANADIIIARTVLDSHESGLYAGGLILVKAVLFLPQFVVVVAFPSMSTSAARRGALIASTVAVLGMGVLATAAAWFFRDLALVFIGGAEYAAIKDELWLFAVLGTLLSTIQLLVYGVVARQSRWSVYLIWGALVVLYVATLRVGTFTEMAVTVCLVDACLFLLLLMTSLWRLASPEVEDLSEAPLGEG